MLTRWPLALALCGAMLLPARACRNDRDTRLGGSLTRFPGIQRGAR